MEHDFKFYQKIVKDKKTGGAGKGTLLTLSFEPDMTYIDLMTKDADQAQKLAEEDPSVLRSAKVT
jgi:hypothetical protein